MTQLQKQIVLNSTEQKIHNVLSHFCDHYNKDKPSAQQLELRITGGWVRDKLLNRESHDVDIAVNVLSGEEFAMQLLQFASEQGYDLGLNCSNIHKIKKNPEKSKHLETCTTKIFGLDIDFVNLRSEQYTDDSRVPVIECGTAEEDALRRDATLNALFYNINKNEIEDLTGRGLQDLQAGVLRTPLQPLQTFLDDPLRVLRLIRFASQFDFTIEQETLLAMTNADLKTALVHKISRERVGVELEKILKSANVPYGLRLINYVGLTAVLFDSGTVRPDILRLNDLAILDELRIQEQMVDTRVDEATQIYSLFCESIGESSTMGKLTKQIMSNSNARKQFWLYVILQPYGGLSVKTNDKKRLELKYVEVVIKEGLRFGKSDYDVVSKLCAATQDDFLHKHFETPCRMTRADLGAYIRDHGESFELNLVGNAFLDVLNKSPVADRIKDHPTIKGNSLQIDPETLKYVVTQYDNLLALIDLQNLQNVREMKPIVDGKMVSQSLQRKPGPWMREVTDEVIVWQLNNPEGSKEECLEHIKHFMKALDLK